MKILNVFDTGGQGAIFGKYNDGIITDITKNRLTAILSKDQTTQIDVKVSREPRSELFVFHPGDDVDDKNKPILHVKWNRQGEITKKRLKVK